MSTAIATLERIVGHRIFDKFDVLNSEYVRKLKTNPLAVKYIVFRTSAWDALNPTLKDRINILTAYRLVPERCQVCGSIKFDWKRFCSRRCANNFRTGRKTKHPSLTKNGLKIAARKEKQTILQLCDGKHICWIETKEHITLRQYAVRCSKQDSKIEEFFCYLDGRVVSNHQYVCYEAARKLKETPSPDPAYVSMSAYRNRNRKGLNTVHKPKPISECKKKIGCAEDYYYLVWKYTEKSLKEYPIDGYDGRSPDLHVDHIFSIRDGIKYKIHPAVIGDSVNLRMLNGIINSTKGRRSDITMEELYRRYRDKYGDDIDISFETTEDFKAYFSGDPIGGGNVPLGYIRFGTNQTIDPKFYDVIMHVYQLRKKKVTLVKCSEILVAAGLAANPQTTRSLIHRIARDNNEISFFESFVYRKLKDIS